MAVPVVPEEPGEHQIPFLVIELPGHPVFLASRILAVVEAAEVPIFPLVNQAELVDQESL